MPAGRWSGTNTATDTAMQTTTKPWSPVPSGIEIVHDQGGGCVQLGLRSRGAKNHWVKKSRQWRVSKLKLAMFNTITLLRDEHMQELEEELRETRLEWGVIGIGEVRRRGECFTILQVVIIFKNGNKKHLNNHRPILCLVSNICKVLMKELTKRLEKILDEIQPRGQAGFRSGYSTTDHIYEYNIPLCIAFVDYEKAFDSVQT